MFKIYSDKINIIKTSSEYMENCIIEMVEPLMSNRDNYVCGSEIKLKRLISMIEVGDTIIFNSRGGISFKKDNHFNIITINQTMFNDILVNKRRIKRDRIINHVNNIVRLQKIKTLMG